MRFIISSVAALALLVPGVTNAEEDLREEMRQMRELVLQLQDTVSVQSEQLSEQKEVIDRAGIAEDRASASSVENFVKRLELGGWISASYFYNFNDIDGVLLGGANTGGANVYPFKPDSNSFSLDQLWFEIEHPIDEENRAGFRADIAFGKSARILSGNGIATDGIEVYQAYVQYLAPIGDGIEIKFGKFGTLIGAEVVQAPYNFNITRGNVYNLFQPITHIGVLASTTVGPVDVTAGFVNETRCFPACDIDLDRGKAFLWSLGIGNDELSLSFAGTHGSSESGSGGANGAPAGVDADEDETILDVILSWNPNEKFSSYVNIDWIKSEADLAIPAPTTAGRFGDLSGVGISAAGRYAITDRLGAAFRAEYVDLRLGDNVNAAAGPVGTDDLAIWGLTGTVDYGLTEALMVRGELRYDNGSIDQAGGIFFEEDGGGSDGSRDSQVTAGVEVIYSF